MSNEFVDEYMNEVYASANKTWGTYTPTVGTVQAASSSGRYYQLGSFWLINVIVTISASPSGTQTFLTFDPPPGCSPSYSTGEVVGVGRENAFTGMMLHVHWNGSAFRAGRIDISNMNVANHVFVISLRVHTA